jgi:uncharacterized cupin superfamily protein
MRVRTLLVSLLAATSASVSTVSSSGQTGEQPTLIVMEADDLEGKDLPLADPLPKEMMLSGSPQNWMKFLYRGQVAVGIWQAGAQKLTLDPQSVDEYFFVLEGNVTVTSKNGDAKKFGPGDAFVLSKDFVGTWETLGTYRHLVVANPSTFGEGH